MKFRCMAMILPVSLLLVSCETPLGEAWNNTVAEMNRKRESERELIYHGNSPTPRPTPKAKKTVSSPAPKKVRLQPFLDTDTPATASPTPTPEKSSPPVPEKVESKKSATSTPTPSGEAPPFASPVPGKKGFVTSPYSPSAGFIDVSGLAPGSEARDPYSGKIFRVP